MAKPAIVLPSPPRADFWPESVGGGWATALVVFLIIIWQFLRAAVTRVVAYFPLAPKRPVGSVATADLASPTTENGSPLSSSSSGVSKVISDADLEKLIDELDAKLDDEDGWEKVIEKKNDLISYSAKCCMQKDGPPKYLSITTFEKCSTELLKDFYMDNEYRKKWDKTVVDSELLDVDEVSAIEVGRTIKKFPLLTPREYVLAWCLWQGKDKSFYCFTKDCEHPRAPLQKKYVRVGFYRSGWRIRNVPGRDACEIKMVHQEDAGLNIDMAKLAFAKGIWNYVCKMDGALREYSSWTRNQPSPVSQPKVIPLPPGLERDSKETALESSDEGSSKATTVLQETSSRTPSKKWIAKGLIILGGVVCLSRGHSTLATQLAMACFLKKLTKQGVEPEPNEKKRTPEDHRSKERTSSPLGHQSWYQISNSSPSNRASPGHSWASR